MWIVLGNALGGRVLLALVLTGLGVIVAASERLVIAVKVAGAFYLTWLGIQSIRSAPLQMLTIGLVGGVAHVLIETLWVCAAGALRTWFRRRPSRVRHLKTGGGIAMIGLGGRLALERGPERLRYAATDERLLCNQQPLR